MPKISVIIPVYNAVSYIPQSLPCLMNQTMRDYELIFINDGSFDQSEELLRDWQKKDHRIKIISQENSGQAIARNKGIEVACGEYICFIDIDDVVSIHMFERLYQKAKAECADIVWSNARIIKGNQIQGYLDDDAIWTGSMRKDYLLNNASPWRKLIKTDLIKKHKLFFPHFLAYEDLAIVPLYGLFANKICYIEEALYDYKKHDGSTMHQLTYHKKMECIFECVQFLQEGFKEKQKQKYQAELEYLLIDHLLHAASLRFFEFEEGKKQLDHIIMIMKNDYPNWKKNSYFKKKDWKYRFICYLFYHKQYWFLKYLLK